jgi:hypothetical protein
LRIAMPKKKKTAGQRRAHGEWRAARWADGVPGEVEEGEVAGDVGGGEQTPVAAQLEAGFGAS